MRHGIGRFDARARRTARRPPDGGTLVRLEAPLVEKEVAVTNG